MVNIANNHSYDCYSKGFESTKAYLQTAGIDYIGDTDVEKSFVVKEIKAKKIAFVGIDRTVSSIPIGKYYELVRRLKSENDFVVVDIHWGTEYSLLETNEQTFVAHGLIDNGADIIFGHHPHVIEPVKAYKGKIIFYSLGNFVFDQTGENENTGLGVGADFNEGKIKFNLFPYKIKVFAPDFLKGEDKNKFCEKFLNDFEHTECSFGL
jgi:poly-gamma-glutamate synthesis protein (capsule biosynthesis protein)